MKTSKEDCSEAAVAVDEPASAVNVDLDDQASQSSEAAAKAENGAADLEVWCFVPVLIRVRENRSRAG